MATTEFMLGKREQISISDAETTYGTVATPKIVLGRNATFDPNKNAQNVTEVLSTGAGTLDVEAREFGQEDWGGVLSFTPQDWRFLKFVLCDVSSDVTDTNTGPTTHTFTNATAGLLSFTLERAIKATTPRVRRYEGCQMDQLALSWDSTSAGNFLQAQATILAEDCNNGTAVTDITAPTTEGFKPRHVLLTLEGGKVAYLKSGTFTITNGLSDGRYANSDLDRVKGESSQTTRKYNLTAVAEYVDDTFFDMLDSADLLGSTNTLAFTRSATDKLTTTFTGAYLNKAPDPTVVGGKNQVTLNIDINSAAFVAVDALTNYETFT